MKRCLISAVIGHLAGTYSLVMLNLLLLPDGAPIVANGSAMWWLVTAPIRVPLQLLVGAVLHLGDTNVLCSWAMYIAASFLTFGFAFMILRERRRVTPTAQPSGNAGQPPYPS